MTDKFTLDEYYAAKSERFEINEEVQEKVRSLVVEALMLCKEHDIPFHCSSVVGNVDGQYHLRTSGNLPLTRTPVELLIMNTLSFEGMENAVGLITELIVRGAKTNDE